MNTSIKVQYRVNPTDRHGAVKLIDYDDKLTEIFTEVDDKKILCTKEMWYLRKCWILNQTPDQSTLELFKNVDKTNEERIKKKYPDFFKRFEIGIPNTDFIIDDEKSLAFECCKVTWNDNSSCNQIIEKLNFNTDFSEQDQLNIRDALDKIKDSFPDVTELSIINRDYSTHFIFKEETELISTYNDLISTISEIEKDGRFSTYNGRLSHSKISFLNESLQYLYDNNCTLFKRLMQVMKSNIYSFSITSDIIDNRLVSVYRIHTRRGNIIITVFTEAVKEMITNSNEEINEEETK